jgi:hypothetical protein
MSPQVIALRRIAKATKVTRDMCAGNGLARSCHGVPGAALATVAVCPSHGDLAIIER